MAGRDELSFRSVLVLFLLLEVSIILIVAAGVAVVHVSDSGGALGTLFFAPVHS